jgi:general stress protein CsbA
MFHILRNKTKFVVIFLTVLVLMAASAYSGYLYSECKWSQTLASTSLLQIRENLDTINAIREGKSEDAIGRANLGISRAAYGIQILDATEFSSSKETSFKQKTLSDLQKEWQAHPYDSCDYPFVQDDALKQRMEESCLGLRQYINQYQ